MLIESDAGPEIGVDADDSSPAGASGENARAAAHACGSELHVHTAGEAGKQVELALVRVASLIAAATGMSPELVVSTTRQNAMHFFFPQSGSDGS